MIKKSVNECKFSTHNGGLMRKLLLLSLALISQQGLACISVADTYVCAGETVYKGTSYSQGAIVVAENPYYQQVTVRSNVSGNLAVENVMDLDLTKGCLGQVCVGQKIMKGTSYSQGATVVAINYSRQSVTVRSVVSGNLAIESLYDLEVTSGCASNVCTGDLVYKGTSYSQGARVESLNFSKNFATVRSVVSGNLAQENLSDLYFTRGCLGSVCINDRVFKGSSYSQGATVLAINFSNYRATVRSVVSGNLSDDSIYELQGGTNQPQWPAPTPLPLPPGPGPGPSPRPPTRPEPAPMPPAPRYETCTVNRLDPSGLFITSYTQTGYTKSEACRSATDMCFRDLKGRQTCNIAR